MAPFNQSGAMDDAAVLAKDLPFADGDRKRLDIYAPKQLSGPAPVVMFIYGGSWKQGRRQDYQFVGQALAANGFIVVIPDYRLYPEVTYPAFLEDNAQAVKWIEDNIATYGGDTSRFFIAGHSAGAYNSVMLGLERSFLRDYNVTMPIKGIAAISGPYDFYPFEYDEVRSVFGQNDNPQGTQPINLVAPDRPPMLIVSGTSDPIVRVQNSQHFAAKMREAGDWVTEKYYDGLGHMEPAFAIGAMWRWRAPVLQDMVSFFTQFGAFPSGAPRPAYTPEAPAGVADMQATIDRLDDVLSPIEAQRPSQAPAQGL
ncbi:MAG: alpha/beta hydrolase [Hyphomicrobiales bacterium]|nr:MAG: alpha/beta hydrolase [Hyphomicrobiales bacterium]